MSYVWYQSVPVRQDVIGDPACARWKHAPLPCRLWRLESWWQCYAKLCLILNFGWILLKFVVLSSLAAQLRGRRRSTYHMCSKWFFSFDRIASDCDLLGETSRLVPGKIGWKPSKLSKQCQSMSIDVNRQGQGIAAIVAGQAAGHLPRATRWSWSSAPAALPWVGRTRYPEGW